MNFVPKFPRKVNYLFTFSFPFIKEAYKLRLKEQYIDNLIVHFRSKLPYMAYYFTKQLREEIGKNLKKIRKMRGLKQVELAVDAGLNSSYYGKIERGLVNPSLEKVYRIIKSLHIRSSDILPF